MKKIATNKGRHQRDGGLQVTCTGGRRNCGPISVEVVSQDGEGMITEATGIVGWTPNVWGGTPITSGGFEAISLLSKDGIKVNQDILGVWAGPTVVSLFVGRLGDAGYKGIQVIAEMASFFKRHKLNTLVMAASIRHLLHCVAAAKAGADIANVPFNVLFQMVQHPLTDTVLAT